VGRLKANVELLKTLAWTGINSSTVAYTVY